MIAFQLKLLEWIIHKKMKFYKMFAASIFGSFSGCLILQLFDEDHGLKLGLMIISIVMTVKISCALTNEKSMEIQRVSSGIEFIYWWDLYNDKKARSSCRG